MDMKTPQELGDEALNVVSGGAGVIGTGTKKVNASDTCNQFVCVSCDGGRKFLWSKTHYCVAFDIDGSDGHRSCNCENCRYYIHSEGACSL